MEWSIPSTIAGRSCHPGCPRGGDRRAGRAVPWPAGSSSPAVASMMPTRCVLRSRRHRWPVIADPRSGCRLRTPRRSAHADSWSGTHRGRPLTCRVVSDWRAARVEGAGPVARALCSVAAGVDRARGLAGSRGTRPLGRCTAAARRTCPRSSARRTGADTRRAGGCGRALAARKDAEGRARILRQPSRWRSRDRLTEPGVARAVALGAARGAWRSRRRCRSATSNGSVRLQRATVHSNRGANGIDGVVSTAVGVAWRTGAPTAVLSATWPSSTTPSAAERRSAPVNPTPSW